ncbi:serine hydrolase domain-containing protein [Allonocardiopsis opalescens]|uniref:CubicO group peptidase (Beta-lactamase class C family) n=1 Tax=Allonocardiopsis opalescens TaxID=1144618 RepID=A0A2T0QC46_9ACTN|nr:serine hydrolase domain-containing protein [Allonocardiopsis opalescens]PRY01482.1 CubicO group peptidase (beta-lactamase class C family) [Allonocardiopsis opalescens]
MRKPSPPARTAAVAALTAVLLGLAAPAAQAAAPSGTAEPVAEPTAAAVEDFLDRRVPELLAEFEVPGAAVSVVAGGEQVFAGGYGTADPATGRPVEAGTAFPVGSVAKSFTALAVLRLVDEGRLDLHADVNGYLPPGSRIADTFPGEPVTLHHLLTHTAGFEEAVAGQAAAEPGGAAPLAAYVRDRQPERVRPPGRFTSYSNYGLALAGLIVQEVSGRPFAAYAAEQVFAPLGMEASAFAGPDEARERGAAVPHTAGPDGPVPAPELHLAIGPAGGAYSSAEDMARFMLALLDAGGAGGEQRRPEPALAAMGTRQAGNEPRLTGAGYGTWEWPSDGARAYGHGGTLVGAHANYVVLPELGLGVHVATNGDGRGDPGAPLRSVQRTLVEEVLAEFAGIRAVPGPGPAADVPLDRYTGDYVPTRASRSDATAATAALGQLRVGVADDGALTTSGPMIPEARWTAVEPGLFRAEDGTDQLAFIERGGAVVGLALDSAPMQPFERTAWHLLPTTHLAAAGIALLVAATAAVWPVTALVRRLRRRDPAPYRGAARWARLPTAAAVLLSTGFTGYLLWLLTRLDNATVLRMVDSPVLTAPLAAAVPLAALAAVLAVLAWRRGWWTAAGRVQHTVIVPALGVFLLVGHVYNFVWTPFG